MPERCDRCRFFHPNPPAHKPDVISIGGDTIQGGGDCRRTPPAWRELDVAYFPLVACHWWCGEFEASARTDVGGAVGPRWPVSRSADEVVRRDHPAPLATGANVGEAAGTAIMAAK